MGTPRQQAFHNSHGRGAGPFSSTPIPLTGPAAPRGGRGAPRRQGPGRGSQPRERCRAEHSSSGLPGRLLASMANADLRRKGGQPGSCCHKRRRPALGAAGKNQKGKKHRCQQGLACATEGYQRGTGQSKVLHTDTEYHGVTPTGRGIWVA